MQTMISFACNGKIRRSGNFVYWDACTSTAVAERSCSLTASTSDTEELASSFEWLNTTWFLGARTRFDPILKGCFDSGPDSKHLLLLADA